MELQFYALVAVALRLGLRSQIDRVLLGWISYSALRAVIETPDVLDSVLLTSYAHYFVAGALVGRSKGAPSGGSDGASRVG